MTKKEFAFLSTAFPICYLAIGIPYWLTPYSLVSLPDSLFNVGLLLMSMTTLVFCARGTGFLWTVAILGTSAPSAVMTRVIMDTMHDASTHNLWPFEIAIAIFIGFATAGFFGAIGFLLRKIFRIDHENPRDGGG